MKRRILLIPIIILLIYLVVVLSACKVQTVKIENLNGIKPFKISIELPGGKNINFTQTDALKMKLSTLHVVNNGKCENEHNQEWIGLPLKSILEFAGSGNYKSVTILSVDGLKENFDTEVVNEDTTILGFALNGRFIDETRAPAQLVVKSQPTNTWVKKVIKITIN